MQEVELVNATAGYSGGGSESDLAVEGGGWDMTDYTSTSARKGVGRTEREKRDNPTQSVAGPSTYEGEVAEPQIDPSVFKKKKSKHGYKKRGGNRTKSWI